MSLDPRRMQPLYNYRFPSVGDHIYATLTFEHAWATPRHAVIGCY